MSVAELSDFYFLHDEMFVVPIEGLTPRGIEPEMSCLLRQRRGISEAWVDLFNASFSLYWQRASDLAARDPEHWPPPRLQHCCIVTDPRRVRPYFQPFNNCSWLLYEGDFAPRQSNGAYLFLHMERMGLRRDVTQALLLNLSYWLAREEAEIASFVRACGRSQRPDASGFRALAAAMPWIRQQSVEVFSSSNRLRGETLGLHVPLAEQPKLEALRRNWAAATQRCLDDFRLQHARRGKDRAGELCAWLEGAAPLVLVSGRDGQILWDPEAPQAIRDVRRALGGLGETTAQSLRADLETIDRLSRAFLGSVRDPAALRAVPIDVSQGGLSYLHRERRLIAYNLNEPGMERLRVPAPPYERLMLAARTMHEWGHLAAEAGWVRMSEQRRHELASHMARLQELFEEIHAGLPPHLRELAAPEVDRLRRQHGSLGAGLLQIPLVRMADYQANLLARRYLSRAELETYIRNNVYCLRWTSPPAAFLQRLVRSVFEAQYLELSLVADRRRYLLSSTWFDQDYLHSGTISESQLEELLSLVQRLCAAQEVDDTKLVPR